MCTGPLFPFLFPVQYSYCPAVMSSAINQADRRQEWTGGGQLFLDIVEGDREGDEQINTTLPELLVRSVYKKKERTDEGPRREAAVTHSLSPTRRTRAPRSAHPIIFWHRAHTYTWTMHYGNAPSSTDVDRTGGAFDAPAQGHHIHDSENVLTLDQLHHGMHGKGNKGNGARNSRLVFGSIGNTSRLVSEAHARKRGGSGSGDAKHRTMRTVPGVGSGENSPTPPKVQLVSGGSARSGATGRSTARAASNDGMDWDPTGDEAAAMQAAASRHRAGFHGSSNHDHGSSPRTPVVESPDDSEGAGRTDDDDATPLPQPGALTIQRMNLRRRYPGFDLDSEMEEQHRRQHAVMQEGSVARLLRWRDPARTAVFFSTGVALLAAARAPGLVAEHVPVNPVVVAAYLSMAYLCRAYFMAMAFPRRNHGLRVDEDGAAECARWCAQCVNAVTATHNDMLSGRSNKGVLCAFTGLYAISSLGGLLNSTWWVAAVLWVGAFVAPPVVEAKRCHIAAASAWVSTKVGGRWAALTSNQRWGSGAAIIAGVFLASPVNTRLILLFVTLVAFRLYRETHAKQMESFERVVKDAGRRLSRAGSEFHAMVGSPAQLFYRRRAAANNSQGMGNGMSTLGGSNSGISWN